jgi:hypothetical protein
MLKQYVVLDLAKKSKSCSSDNNVITMLDVKSALLGDSVLSYAVIGYKDKNPKN